MGIAHDVEKEALRLRNWKHCDRGMIVAGVPCSLRVIHSAVMHVYYLTDLPPD